MSVPMTKKLTASEEEQRLRQATREAHEAMQGLADLLRQAHQLAPTLIDQFSKVHKAEIKQLSDYITDEMNRHARSLNADVERAKDMIFNQIMTGDLVFDADSQTLQLKLGTMRFDDQQPYTTPQIASKETSK